MNITNTNMVRRLCHLYRQSTEWQRSIGVGWYPMARTESSVLDIVNPSRAAGVIAALSPRCQWSVNLRWSAQVIAASDSWASECPAVSTLTHRAKAWRIAEGLIDPLEAFDPKSAPKTRAFYRNLTGDDSAVTVDVWATYAATGLTGTAGASYLSRAGNYDRIADAYRRAAVILSRSDADMAIAPSALQAVVWTIVRGVKPTDSEWHRAAAHAHAHARVA